jgi:hypothetical protein
MIENAHVETASFIWLIAGTVLWVAVPVAAAIIWKVKKVLSIILSIENDSTCKRLAAVI